ncbi:MAG: 2-oxo acid dehydrogenase subunit E2 [Clostridia bacterium]|nr:2-oxo acid dehydrogenase subunit E2 [Clostridia bacterium]
MRTDGKRVRNEVPDYYVGAHLMNKRYDALNMIEVDVPLAPISAYVREKRKEGRRVSHLGVILTAYLRTVAEFYKLNRFFVNKRPYARTDLSIGMVVLKPGDTDGTTSKFFLEYENDIFDVQRVLDEYVDGNRKDGDTNRTDRIARFLVNMPGLLSIGVSFIKLLDHLGWLPKAIIDASPFHSSMVISNLASIGTNHIYHHVYHFGTTSVILTIGVTKEIPRRHGDKVRFERCLPFGIVMDERICTGSYFAAAFARFKEYLADPTLLEGESKYPIIREWAKPGDYEKLRAKRVYAEEKKRIAAKFATKSERREPLRRAKAEKKRALAEARSLKRAAKKKGKQE